MLLWPYSHWRHVCLFVSSFKHAFCTCKCLWRYSGQKADLNFVTWRWQFIFLTFKNSIFIEAKNLATFPLKQKQNIGFHIFAYFLSHFPYRSKVISYIHRWSTWNGYVFLIIVHFHCRNGRNGHFRHVCNKNGRL